MQSRPAYPRFRRPPGQPVGERPHRQRVQRPPSVRLAPEGLHIYLLLLGVGQHVHPAHVRRRLLGYDGERVHADQGAADGVGQRLRRHDADAKSGIAARPATDDDAVQVARLPPLRGQQLRRRRGQVARVPPGLVQPPHAAQDRALRQRHETAAARSLHK